MPKDVTSEPQMKIVAQPNRDLTDQIRRRAYELYEARGRQEGQELQDWLRAETEITGKKARAVSAN